MTNTSTLSKTDQKIDELVLEADISYVAAVFDNVDDANSAYKKLKHAQRDGIVTIIDAAYAEKTDHDRLKVHDHDDWIFGEKILGAGAGGAVVGGLIGIVAGAILMPAAIGALIGAAFLSVFGHKTKFSHEDLKEIADTLPIGTSVLVAIVENEFLEIVEVEVHKLGGKKVHSNSIPKNIAASLATSK
jgi:uncharacterized membrane protein